MRFTGIKPVLFIIPSVFIATYGFSQNNKALKGDYLEICEHDKAWSTSTLKGPKSNPVKYNESNIVDGDIKTV